MAMCKHILVFLSMVALSSVSRAGGLELYKLTPESADALGFSITIKDAPEAILGKLVGPKTLEGDCVVWGSGSALMDEDGHELMVTTTLLDPSIATQEVFGYYTNRNHSMSVWLGYMCGSGQHISRRYVIDSIANYFNEAEGS